MVVSDNKENVRIVEKITIGTQLRAIRTSNKLTLDETSKLTGLARSTLSKIENDQTSPTFTVMKKLASGFNIELPQLFTKPKESKITGRRDITLNEQGSPHATLTYEHELLAVQLRNKKMMPYKSRIHARNFEHFGEWIHHEGEEFLLVLEGEVQLLTEFYEPATLTEGDSAYYDATMGHLVISTSKKDALILWVTAE
jgi:transcriptional regulator with XRE-family HTH domain